MIAIVQIQVIYGSFYCRMIDDNDIDDALADLCF